MDWVYWVGAVVMWVAMLGRVIGCDKLGVRQ